MKPLAMKPLSEVRAEIDKIDGEVHALIMRRAELVRGVAEAKAQEAGLAGAQGFTAFRPGREAEVMRALAARHQGDLPLQVIFRIWRELMATATCMQGAFRVEVFGGSQGLSYWDLARSYFGSSTDMEQHSSARDVVRRVANDIASIGILPHPGPDEGGDWWLNLVSGEGAPRIVARLPFLEIEGAEDGPVAFVIGQADFEETGDDTTLLAVSTSGTGSEGRMSARVEAAGFIGERLSVIAPNVPDAPRYSLFAVPGFIRTDDPRLAQLARDDLIETVRVLGGYANPVRRVRDGA